MHGAARSRRCTRSARSGTASAYYLRVGLVPLTLVLVSVLVLVLVLVLVWCWRRRRRRWAPVLGSGRDWCGADDVTAKRTKGGLRRTEVLVSHEHNAVSVLELCGLGGGVRGGCGGRRLPNAPISKYLSEPASMHLVRRCSTSTCSTFRSRSPRDSVSDVKARS